MILGFSPFFLKTSVILTARKHKALGPIACTMEGWQWMVTLWCMTKWNFLDLKIIEWCQGSVDPAETWWHGLIPKEFIQHRPPLDSKGILRSLHERLTSNIPYNFLWASSTSSWSNEFSSQMCKSETLRILFFNIFFFSTITSVCRFHCRILT